MAREQLRCSDGLLEGLAEEPVLDLGRTPVEGGSPAQRGVEALQCVINAVADGVKRRARLLGLSRTRAVGLRRPGRGGQGPG